MKLVTQRALPTDPHARAAKLRKTIKSGTTPGADARGELARCLAVIEGRPGAVSVASGHRSEAVGA